MKTLIGLKSGIIFEVEVNKQDILNNIQNKYQTIEITKRESEILMRRPDGKEIDLDEVSIFSDSISFVAYK